MDRAVVPERDAKAYARIRRRLATWSLALEAAYLLALPSIGIAQWWAARVAVFSPWAWQVTAYVAGLAIPWTAATFPFDAYRGFHLEHRFGLSRERFGAWLWRWGKAQAIGGVLLIMMAVIVAWALRARPQAWWLWVAAIWIVWSVVLTQWMPVALLPLFYRQRPVTDPALVARVRRLAQQCGAPVRGVYEIDFSRETVKANACLCGLGATRRIVLTDTLTRDYTPEEIEAVLAHELGHHRLRHLPRLLTIGASTTLISLWLVSRWLPRWAAAVGVSSASSLAALPLIALALHVIQVILTPLHNGVSRRFERAADRFALELTRAPQHFIAAMRKLQRQNLAEASPSRWVEWFWYDHPPIAKRVAMAEQFSQ